MGRNWETKAIIKPTTFFVCYNKPTTFFSIHINLLLLIIFYHLVEHLPPNYHGFMWSTSIINLKIPLDQFFFTKN